MTAKQAYRRQKGEWATGRLWKRARMRYLPARYAEIDLS